MFSFHSRAKIIMSRLFWSDMIYGLRRLKSKHFLYEMVYEHTISIFSLLKRFVHGNLASGSGLLCETMINWFHYSFKHLFDDVLAWKTIGRWVSEKPKSINPGLSDQRLVFSLNSRNFFSSMIRRQKPNLTIISIMKRFQAKLLASFLPQKIHFWLALVLDLKYAHTPKFRLETLSTVVTLSNFWVTEFNRTKTDYFIQILRFRTFVMVYRCKTASNQRLFSLISKNVLLDLWPSFGPRECSWLPYSRLLWFRDKQGKSP